MPFDNTQFVYGKLPARFRRDDDAGLLRRFLSFYGGTMDEWDEAFDAFANDIASGTAASKWVKFWLLVLFGWSWFPWWFQIVDMRRLYGNFARHLGRRGTRRGIELWLADFGILARVHTRMQPYGEFVWGETHFGITEPLHLIVEILSIKTSPIEACFLGETAYGDGFYARPRAAYSQREIIELIRYVQPQSQEVVIVWRAGSFAEWDDGETYWRQISW